MIVILASLRHWQTKAVRAARDDFRNVVTINELVFNPNYDKRKSILENSVEADQQTDEEPYCYWTHD